MNTRMPGTAASLLESDCATSSALMSLGAVLEVHDEAALVHRADPAPPPTADMKPSMLGSSWTMAAAARWCCTIAS